MVLLRNGQKWFLGLDKDVGGLKCISLSDLSSSIGFLHPFYTIPTYVAPYASPNRSHNLSLVLGSRLLPYLCKRTFRPFWCSLQHLPYTPSRQHIQRSWLLRLFPAFPPSYLCYDLSLGIRSKHLCTGAYGVVSWTEFVKWAEEDKT